MKKDQMRQSLTQWLHNEKYSVLVLLIAAVLFAAMLVSLKPSGTDGPPSGDYAEYEKRHQINNRPDIHIPLDPINIISNTQLPQNHQVIRIELNPDGSVKKISKNKK